MSFLDWGQYMSGAGNGYGTGTGSGADSYGNLTSSNATDIGGSNSGWGSVLGSIFGSGNNGGGSSSPSAQNSGSIFSSPTWSDLLSGAKFGYAISQSKTPPKFTNVPMSPEQQKLWDLYYQYQTDPATSGNRALVSGYAREALNNIHPTWTPPKTSTGETGYNGTANRQFPQLPPFDWTGYLGSGVKSNTAPTTPAAASSGNPGATLGGSGTNGAATGVFAPVGSSGDPFANMPAGFAQDVNPSDIASFISKYGKGAFETVIGLYSMNPILGGKGVMDLYRSIHSDPNDPLQQPTQPTGPQETAQTLSNNPAGMPPSRTNLNTATPIGDAANSFINNQNLGLMFGGGMGNMGGWGMSDMYGTSDTPTRVRKT